MTFGALKDATTQQPLFTKQSWKEAEIFLTHIGSGYLSNPPGISLYQARRKDKYGLNVYRCLRGTNSLGGVYQNLNHRFGAPNASMRLTIALMTELVFRIVQAKPTKVTMIYGSRTKHNSCIENSMMHYQTTGEIGEIRPLVQAQQKFLTSAWLQESKLKTLVLPSTLKLEKKDRNIDLLSRRQGTYF
ncbi:hypothetical protein INT45_000102 [Circinella minor]|uniref:Uncharacterized protein n=1 Tax=Circinella minor TaxID=1195481 RepID=A0A8H7S9A0_9FUNG|nr:hypothetical protein INT45_000102 [Circinella minor]